jgi:hypothetical protein
MLIKINKIAIYTSLVILLLGGLITLAVAYIMPIYNLPSWAEQRLSVGVTITSNGELFKENVEAAKKNYGRVYFEQDFNIFKPFSHRLNLFKEVETGEKLVTSFELVRKSLNEFEFVNYSTFVFSSKTAPQAADYINNPDKVSSKYREEGEITVQPAPAREEVAREFERRKQIEIKREQEKKQEEAREAVKTPKQKQEENYVWLMTHIFKYCIGDVLDVPARVEADTFFSNNPQEAEKARNCKLEVLEERMKYFNLFNPELYNSWRERVKK